MLCARLVSGGQWRIVVKWWARGTQRDPWHHGTRVAPAVQTSDAAWCTWTNPLPITPPLPLHSTLALPWATVALAQPECVFDQS